MAEDPITWATLKASARAWLVDIETGAISDDQLEEFIAFAERHFQRTIFTPDREAALSLSATTQVTALPTDFWGFKSPPYIDAAMDVPLVKLTPGDLRATYRTTTTGIPAHYAIEGKNLLLGPTPSSSQSVKGTYYQTIPALNSGTATNWLLTDCPDIYLAGLLHHAFLFQMDEARAGMWAAKASAAIEDLNRAGQRRSNSGPLVANHGVGSIPNIQA
jgi:hypothetical protein